MDGTVKQILGVKGFDVAMVEPQTSLKQCAQIMKDNGIGSLLVVDDDELKGILHERDICRRAVSHGLDLTLTAVEQIMDTEFPTVTLSTTVMEAMAIISEHRVRHLPVIDSGELVGVVSIGDVTKWVLDLQEEDLHQLVSYILGTTNKFSITKLNRVVGE